MVSIKGNTSRRDILLSQGNLKRMNLLLFNLATDADDPILGFTTTWIRALAKHCDMIHVITMRQGRLELPGNVHVYSVGKEKGYSEPRRAIEFYRHLIHILSHNEINACFAHMIPLFAIMGAPLLKMKGIPIILWYTHGHVSYTLRLADKLVNKIVTASSESCRLLSKKILVTGHGINVNQFYYKKEDISDYKQKINLLYVGRIDPIKKVEVVIKALPLLAEHNPNLSITLKIVGSCSEKNAGYKQSLHDLTTDLGLSNVVEFIGSIPHEMISDFYRNADFILNPSQTGSIDKTLLEGICAGAIPVTSNVAYKDGLSSINQNLYANENTPNAFCECIENILKLDKIEIEEIILKCQNWVLENHSLDSLVAKLMLIFKVR